MADRPEGVLLRTLVEPVQGGTIEELLRALRDDDIERRQAAVASLTILGEGGLDAIAEARRDADVETEARLAQIEARIRADVRRRTFPGGAPVLGLKAALEARWEADRDQMVFSLEIMNVDAHDGAVVEPEGWDVRLPRWSWGANRNRQRLEIRAVRVDGLDMTTGGGRRISVSGCGGFSAPPLVPLQPGEGRVVELRLGRGTDPRALQLRPGDYQARVVYFAKALLPSATEDLETPWISFTVPE